MTPHCPTLTRCGSGGTRATPFEFFAAHRKRAAGPEGLGLAPLQKVPEYFL